MTWGKAIVVGIVAGVGFAVGGKLVDAAWRRVFGT